MKSGAATGAGTIITPAEARRLAQQGHRVKSVWSPNPIQRKILYSKADAILAAGSKGWGKSAVAQVWLLMGDFFSPHYGKPDFDSNPLTRVARSYVYHPHYLAGLIRRNEKDLASFVMDMMPKAKALGLKYIKSPAMFVHEESGAQILLGHAADKDAWMKWQGMNLIRLVVEEAGQIPDFQTFEQLKSCMRSVYPEMRAQILLTANPGGPGQGWLMDYFIEPKTIDSKGEFTGDLLVNPATGQPYQSGEEIEERIENPLVPGEFDVYRRVWITGTLKDNPHAMRSKYIYTLASITDEKMKRMYIHGDWRAGSGRYFDIWSKTRHICPEQHLPGWWRASASLDWGLAHESAAYWAKKNPQTKQTILYKELVASRTDPIELGAELARQSLPELEWQETIVFYISHDAFHDRLGDLTVAELLMKGVAKIIGRNAVYSPDVVVKRLKERAIDHGSLWDFDTEEALRKERRKGINFVMAPKSRAVGWLHMRSMMRLNPIVEPGQIDIQLYFKLLLEDGLDKATRYAHMFQQAEVLPQFLIMDGRCPRLVAAIPKAIHDDKNPEDVDPTHFHGMDSLDSCFVAGTKVQTNKGPIDIESIKIGDLVYTRKGLRRVLSAGKTRSNAPVYKLSMSNGDSLVGTGNHPIWVNGCRFSRLDSLRYNDRLLSWSSQFISMGIAIRDLPSPNTEACEFISIHRRETARSLGSNPCTRTLGLPTTGLSRPIITFTTKTTTPSTTISPISNASSAKRMADYMDTTLPCLALENWRPWGESLLKPGIALLKEGPGINSTLNNLSSDEAKSAAGASNAMAPTGAWLTALLDSAPTTANLPTGANKNSTMNCESAPSATETSFATNTSPLVAAPVHALSVEEHGWADVYNLQVEEEEEYFANGVLVHNCRYLLGGMRDEPASSAPFAVQEQKLLDYSFRKHPDLSPNDLIRIRDQFRSEWGDRQPLLLPAAPAFSGVDHSLSDVDI